MSEVSLKLDRGSERVLLDLKRSDEKFTNGIRHGLLRVGQFVRKVARDGIKNPPKTGKVYKTKGRRIRASAPGEYPANRTGDLRRSINFNVQGGSKRMIFGATKNYGKFLELGTRFMDPRPFIRRSVKDTRKNAEIILEKALDEEIKRRT